MSDNQQENPDANPVIQSTRSQIAKWVIIGASGIIIVLASVLIVVSGEKGEAAEKIFSMVIPMLGTWVGTVLAYYFSGENFEKANQSMNQLVEQMKDRKLQQTGVSEAMISRNLMEVVILADGGDGSNINLLTDVIGRLSSTVTRIPVLSGTGIAKYIIHQSLLYKFITEKTIESTEQNKSFDVSNQTLKDFLDYRQMRTDVERTFAFVSVDASLADAKTAMERLTGCQDVFVSEDGTGAKPVKGWLTNIDITRHAKT